MNITQNQTYLNPGNLFEYDNNSYNATRFWTCVATRPRWEKRFTRWLMAQNIHYYMPTYTKTTISHRKRRTTILPLFPGYVFVVGDYTKQSFTRSGAVVRVLKPLCDAENKAINKQLKTIWLTNINNLQTSPVIMPQEGELIEIIDGPLEGTIGRFIKKGRKNCLIIEVDMLETGVQVELPSEYRFKII